MELRKPSDLSESELQGVVDDYQGGLSCKAVAVKYGLKPTTLSSWLSSHDIRKPEVVVPSIESMSDEEISQQVLHDRELSGLRAEAQHYKRLYRASIEQQDVQERIIEAVHSNLSAMPVIDLEPFDHTPANHHGLHTAVAHLSDLHNGEVVDPDVMGFGDGFNATIFRHRVGRWRNHLLKLIDIWRASREIPRLTVLIDGDMVSGIIHDELERTNDLTIVEQTSETAMLISAAIAQVAAYFPGGVHISCTVGNHGRTKQKKEMKEPQVSWDFVCYQLMAQFLSNYDNITFDIPKSKWAITPIENMDWLHFHGDGIRSWAGIPYYGIERAIKNMREALMVGDLHFDSIAMGHFHHPWIYSIPTGKLAVNGCFKGGDEYAINGLFKHTDPVQHLYLVSDKHGYVDGSELFLKDQKAEDAEGLPLRLSDIWAATKV